MLVAFAAAGLVFGLDLPIGRLVGGVVGVGLLGLLHGWLALALGAAVPNRGLAIGVSAPFAGVGYLIGGLFSLASWLAPFRFLSSFCWIGQSPLSRGVTWWHLSVVMVAALALLLAASFLFERRDLETPLHALVASQAGGDVLAPGAIGVIARAVGCVVRRIGITVCADARDRRGRNDHRDDIGEKEDSLPSMKSASEAFLANERVAVTGVSRTPDSHGSNFVYRRLRDRGYQVFAVNPNADEVEGDPLYPDLSSIPGGVDAVVIGTRPERAEATMRECVDLGIEHVWMHRSFGAGSVSDAATAYGREHGISVIDGGCPCMFGRTADFGHKAMRLVFTLNGNVPRTV